MRIVRKLLWGLLALVVVSYLGAFAWAYWPGPAEVPARSLASADDQFIQVNGRSLRYRVYGAAGADRPDLLLIHGFGNSLQSWRLLAPLLVDCCHVIAIDMPGYGLSDKPVDYDYHNGPQAQMMVDAARALGLHRVVYVGHSLGGAIALQAVIKDADAAGLVLLNPGIITTGVPKIVQLTLPPLPRMSAKLFGSRSFRGDFLRKSYIHSDIVTEQVIDNVMLGARAEGADETILRRRGNSARGSSQGSDADRLGKSGSQ
jgi:pimeloyl-ACP methyl ester carboxylesterase